MSQPLLITIDGNNLARRNHNTTVLSVGDFQVQAIFGFLRSLRQMMAKQRGDTQLLVLWDGKAAWRKAIYPEYKANREQRNAEQQASDDRFHAQVPFIKKLLESMGITQMHNPNLEADDLAGHLIPGVASIQNRPVLLVTGDEDWLQLVHRNVKWYSPIIDRLVTADNFFEQTGYYDQRAFVQGKALIGDTSDNITGVDKFGDKSAQVFLAKWKTVEAFYAAVDAGTYVPASRKSKTATSVHPEQFIASPEGRALFARNMALIDMLQAQKPKPGETTINKGRLDEDKFVLLCQRLNFASILRDLPGFFRDMNIARAAALAS